MKKIPLKEGARKRQNKIRKMVAAGLPLAALMTGLAGCNSELGRGGVVGDEPMRPENSQADMKTPVPAGEPNYQMNVHVVRKGDTLDFIAIKYGTTIEALKKLNGLTDEQAGQLKTGQKIKYK